MSDGILIVDKPAGLTSHDVVAVARRALRERRIGHTGTLDPLATGVLPLACGRATRLVRFLAASEKDYDATIRFGVTTDSYDLTGQVTARSALRPTVQAVEKAVAALTGSYLQLPPAFSAKKIAGQPAYSMARRGEDVALTPVPVTASRVDIIEMTGDIARVRLTCSAGFYVRSFAHSLGELVGTGACLEALRRTRTGEFTIDQAVTVERLTREAESPGALIGLDALLAGFPAVALSDEERNRVAHGQDVVRSASKSAAWVRLIDRRGHLVAVAEPGSTPDSLHPAVVLI